MHEPSAPPNSAADAPIEAVGLTRRYRRFLRGGPIVALDGLTLRVHPGEVFGFLGHNGAGKSTAIKLFTGLLSPTRGHARIFGRSPDDPRARAHIGFLPENPALDAHWTPREFLTLSGRLAGLPSVQASAEIRALADSLAFGSFLDRSMRKLSKGQLQIVGLAHALLGSPPLLILDEPMSGLDPLARRLAREELLARKKQGHTVFLSSHVLSDVERLCDRIGIIRHGRFLGEHDLAEIREAGAEGVEIAVAAEHAGRARSLAAAAAAREEGGEIVLVCADDDAAQRAVRALVEASIPIQSLRPREGRLETFVLERLGRDSEPDASAHEPRQAIGGV